MILLLLLASINPNGEYLLKAHQLALLHLLAPAGPEEISGEVLVEREQDYGAPTPQRFRLSLSAPLPAHTEYLLAPIVQRSKGRYWLLGDPLLVKRGHRRSINSFLKSWRLAVESPKALEIYLELLNHPLDCARRLARDALTTQALEPEHYRQLGRLLLSPGTEEEKKALLKLFKGPKALPELLRIFRHLSPSRVRIRAASLLSRSKRPEAREALRRCAREDEALLQRRCLRLLAR